MLGAMVNFFVQVFERHFGFFHAASLDLVVEPSRQESAH